MLCAPIASAAEPPCSASPECHAPPPPTLLVQPEISVEAPIVGQVVTAYPGTWSHEPVSYSYEWVRCGQSYARACTQIIGAASATYTVTEADLGARIGVEVSAINAGGTGGPAESDLTLPVSPGPYLSSMETLAHVEVSVRNSFSPRAPSQAPAVLRLAFRSMAIGRHFVPDLERIDIEVSRAVVIRTKGLPSCPESTLFLHPSRAAVACAGSLVGNGEVTSEVTLPGKAPAMLHGHLLAFYSFEDGHRAILAQITGSKALPLVYVIPFRFGKARGKFGTSLYVNKSRMRGIQGECTSGHPNCFGTYGFEGIYGHIFEFELSLHPFRKHSSKSTPFVSAICHGLDHHDTAIPVKVSLEYSEGPLRTSSARPRCGIE